MDNFDFNHFEDDLYHHLKNMRIHHRPYHVKIVSELIQDHLDEPKFVYKLRDKLCDLFDVYTEELLEIICSYFNITKPFDIFPINNNTSGQRKNGKVNNVNYLEKLQNKNRTTKYHWNDLANCITNQSSSRRLNIPCVDYETKGVCPRGDTCKFVHPSASLIKPTAVSINSKYSSSVESNTRIPSSNFILPKQSNLYNDLPNVCCNGNSDDSGHNSNNCDNVEETIQLDPEYIDLVHDDELEITHTTHAATVFVPPNILDTPLWYKELGLVENISDDELMNNNKISKKMDNKKSKLSQKSSNRSALVVTNIPKELNTIGVLNKHFRKFGTLLNITVCFENDPTKALIEFRLASEMREANKSSIAVLDNRIGVKRDNRCDRKSSLAFIQTHPYETYNSRDNKRSNSTNSDDRVKLQNQKSDSRLKHESSRHKRRYSSRSLSKASEVNNWNKPPRHKRRHKSKSINRTSKSRSSYKTSRHKRRYISTDKESNDHTKEKRRRRHRDKSPRYKHRRRGLSRDYSYHWSTSPIGRDRVWKMCGTREQETKTTYKSTVHSRLSEATVFDLDSDTEPSNKKDFNSDEENDRRNIPVLETTVTPGKSSSAGSVPIKHEASVLDSELDEIANLSIAEPEQNSQYQQSNNTVMDSCISELQDTQIQLIPQISEKAISKEPLLPLAVSTNTQLGTSSKDIKLEKALNDYDVQECEDSSIKAQRELELATRRNKLKMNKTNNCTLMKNIRLRDSLTFYKALLEAQISQFKRTPDKEVRQKLGPRIKENHELFMQLKTKCAEIKNEAIDPASILENENNGLVYQAEVEILKLRNKVEEKLMVYDENDDSLNTTNDEGLPIEMLLRVDGELNLDTLEDVIYQACEGVKLISSARLNSIASRPHLFSLVCLLPSYVLTDKSLTDFLPVIQSKMPSSNWKLFFPRSSKSSADISL